MQHKLISATRLRNEVFDGASDMWLWRKLNDPALEFPQPIRIAGRRYFREAEIFDWIEKQADEARGAM